MFSRSRASRLIPQGSVYRQGMSGQKEPQPQSPEPWVLVLALSATLDKSLSISGLQSPHLSDGGGRVRSVRDFLLCHCGSGILSESRAVNAFCRMYSGASRVPGLRGKYTEARGPAPSRKLLQAGGIWAVVPGAVLAVPQPLPLSCRFAVTILHIAQCPHGQVSPH